MSWRCARWVEGGALVMALLLPLAFNPWAALPFEPLKARLLQLIAAASLVAAGVCQLSTATRRPGAADQSQPAGGAAQRTLRFLRLGRGHFWPDPRGPAVLYAVVLAAATIWALDPLRSLWGSPDRRHGAVTFLVAIAFSLALARALDARQRIERLLLALVLGSAPVVVYGLAQAAGLDPLQWTTDAASPVLSTMGRSNFLGAYLAVIMPFTAARLLAAPPGHRWGYAALLTMQVACLLLTLARAAVLALLAGGLLLLGLLAWRWRSVRLAAASSAVLVVGVAWLAATQTQTPLPVAAWAEQPASPAFAELRVASVATRSVIWQTTLHLVPARWLLGYGPESFAAVFMAHYPAALGQYQAPGVVVDDAHNLLLNELIAGGLAGLFALLGVVLSFYAAVWRAWRCAVERSWQVTLAAMLAAMTAWLVQAQFNPQVIVLQALFWLLVAVAAATHRLGLAAADSAADSCSGHAAICSLPANVPE